MGGLIPLKDVSRRPVHPPVVTISIIVVNVIVFVMELAYGDPANEIIKWVREKGCDLVAMSTHGHRFLADVFLGTTASRVQHSISAPVLLLRAK